MRTSRARRKRRIVLLVACLLSTAVPVPAAAEVVGIALRVNPHVKGYLLSGKPLREELQPRNLIERGMTVRLINEEAAIEIKLTPAFGCQIIEKEKRKGAQTFSISAVLNLQ